MKGWQSSIGHLHEQPDHQRKHQVVVRASRDPFSKMLTPLAATVCEYQGALFTYGQDAIDNLHVLHCGDGFADKLYRFIDGRAGFDVWRKVEPRPALAEAAVIIAPQLAPK